jgi:hypothetical protein
MEEHAPKAPTAIKATEVDRAFLENLGTIKPSGKEFTFKFKDQPESQVDYSGKFTKDGKVSLVYATLLNALQTKGLIEGYKAPRKRSKLASTKASSSAAEDYTKASSWETYLLDYLTGPDLDKVGESIRKALAEAIGNRKNAIERSAMDALKATLRIVKITDKDLINLNKEARAKATPQN